MYGCQIRPNFASYKKQGLIPSFLQKLRPPPILHWTMRQILAWTKKASPLSIPRVCIDNGVPRVCIDNKHTLCLRLYVCNGLNSHKLSTADSTHIFRLENARLNRGHMICCECFVNYTACPVILYFRKFKKLDLNYLLVQGELPELSGAPCEQSQRARGHF